MEDDGYGDGLSAAQIAVMHGIADDERKEWAISELEAARQRMKAAHGIGEPAIRLDATRVLVCGSETGCIHMRMDDLIALVRKTLKS